MRRPNDTVADREFLTTDPDLLVPAGAWKSVESVNKFGWSVDGVQNTATDIWDRADAAVTGKRAIQGPFPAGKHRSVRGSLQNP